MPISGYELNWLSLWRGQGVSKVGSEGSKVDLGLEALGLDMLGLPQREIRGLQQRITLDVQG